VPTAAASHTAQWADGPAGTGVTRPPIPATSMRHATRRLHGHRDIMSFSCSRAWNLVGPPQSCIRTPDFAIGIKRGMFAIACEKCRPSRSTKSQICPSTNAGAIDSDVPDMQPTMTLSPSVVLPAPSPSLRSTRRICRA
jgi:hypothetical protein